MKTLRRLPKILRYIPGVAQDVRAYFVTMQYWLAGSEKNIANAVRFLVDRYAAGPRAHLKGTLNPAPHGCQRAALAPKGCKRASGKALLRRITRLGSWVCRTITIS